MITFAASWWGTFVYDDVATIALDERVHHPSRFHELWTQSQWALARGNNLSNWRPLTATSFALNWWVTPEAAWSFHLINTLLHGTVTLIVALLAIEILGSLWAGAAVAALFAVHPVHAEAVANISGRSELMAALFALLAWRAHRRGRPIWAVSWFALGVFSKESALTILGVMIVDDLLGRPGSPARPSRDIRPWAAFAAATLLYLAARWAVLGSIGRNAGMREMFLMNPLLAESVTILTQWSTAFKVLGLHWALFLWPARLIADHGWQQIPLARDFNDPGALASLILLMALGVFTAWAWRRRPPLALGILIWFITCQATANLLTISGILFAERLLYLPSLGACLVAGSLIDPLVRSSRAQVRGATAGALAVVIFAMMIRAEVRAWQWNNPLRLWKYDAAAAPLSSQAQGAYGQALRHAGRVEESLAPLRRAIELSRPSNRPGTLPQFPQATRELIRSLLQVIQERRAAGREYEADQLTAELDQLIDIHLQLRPRDAEVLAYRGIGLATKGDLHSAEAAFRQALDADDENLHALCRYGEFLRRVGRPAEARPLLERAVQVHPLVPLTHLTLARLLEDLGESEAAAAEMAEGERLRLGER